MDSFLTKASVSKFLVLSGLILASFSLFLHSMDPMEFLKKVVFTPTDTFQNIYGYVQTIVFWISMACMTAGILGMLLVAVQRWKTRRFFSRLNDRQAHAADGEENWMFL